MAGISYQERCDHYPQKFTLVWCFSRNPLVQNKKSSSMLPKVQISKPMEKWSGLSCSKKISRSFSQKRCSVCSFPTEVNHVNHYKIVGKWRVTIESKSNDYYLQRKVILKRKNLVSGIQNYSQSFPISTNMDTKPATADSWLNFKTIFYLIQGVKLSFHNP